MCSRSHVSQANSGPRCSACCRGNVKKKGRTTESLRNLPRPELKELAAELTALGITIEALCPPPPPPLKSSSLISSGSCERLTFKALVFSGKVREAGTIPGVHSICLLSSRAGQVGADRRMADLGTWRKEADEGAAAYFGNW